MSRCECEHCGDKAGYYLVSDYEHYSKDIGKLAILCNKCSSTTLYPGDTAFSLTEEEFKRIKNKREQE